MAQNELNHRYDLTREGGKPSPRRHSLLRRTPYHQANATVTTGSLFHLSLQHFLCTSTSSERNVFDDGIPNYTSLLPVACLFLLFACLYVCLLVCLFLCNLFRAYQNEIFSELCMPLDFSPHLLYLKERKCVVLWYSNASTVLFSTKPSPNSAFFASNRKAMRVTVTR